MHHIISGPSRPPCNLAGCTADPQPRPCTCPQTQTTLGVLAWGARGGDGVVPIAAALASLIQLQCLHDQVDILGLLACTQLRLQGVGLNILRR